MQTVILLFLSTFLLAQSYPSFSKKELETIRSKNQIAKNRILYYEENIRNLQNETKLIQLNKVNFQLNRLLPQYDSVIHHKEDIWATPKEFLTIGYGDCEDYVIIKYYSLLKLGFDEKKLFLTIVKERYKGGLHMVLSYFKDKKSSPLILDNLSFRILSLAERVDLEVIYFINNTGVYEQKSNKNLKKISYKYKEFEELKRKVAKNL